jgi:hypothetical protein
MTKVTVYLINGKELSELTPIDWIGKSTLRYQDCYGKAIWIPLSSILYVKEEETK